ncbi:hypothetical protein ACGF0J_04795 [Nonomuraea sp. NPDC047897]|uniref:hypothetical protein n=1 Tax=Nonomuraea sp. NPDC047897 TaxID=3364346 RepID=UPI0037159041
MRTIPSLAVSLALATALGDATAWADAGARRMLVVQRAFPLEIILPNMLLMGATRAGNMISATLDEVTVNDTRPGNRSWRAAVSATNFVTGDGAGPKTVSNASVSYWSGPTTETSGSGTRAPGQATFNQRVPLSAQQTAFRASKGPQPTSTSWRPTLVITIPATAPVGTYTGTVVHSVA